MARLVRCRHQHAGNQARQDLERSVARGLVELFPKARCEALPKRTPRWIGRVEKRPDSIARRLPFCGGADPNRSAAESVDEMAQLKQIAKAAQSTRAEVGFLASTHAATVTFVPVSPLGRD